MTAAGTTLLSVMSCVNGTGGCGREFLQRTGEGRWSGVNQVWLDQLPAGFAGRILHGVRIDPTTLRGEAGFYGDRDPNCCPSERLEVDLALDGGALVLRPENVVKEPTASQRLPERLCNSICRVFVLWKELRIATLRLETVLQSVSPKRRDCRAGR